MPGGPFEMGTSAESWALDNERPAHTVDVPAFRIDTAPVTNAAYAAFVDAGGYDDPRWWTAVGWRHRTEAGLVAPHWPKPWGLDADPIHQIIIDDELKLFYGPGGPGEGMDTWEVTKAPGRERVLQPA